MNILLITAMFPPIRTGSSHYASDCATYLSKRGHKVIVVTLKNGVSESPDYDFPVYRLATIHLENLFKRYFKHFRISCFFIQNYWRVITIIKKYNIQGIFLVSHYHDIGLIAAAISFWRGIPLVCSINTQLQSIHRRTEKIFNFFDRLICGKLIFPFCKKVIALDSQILQYLTDVQGDSVALKAVIIPYGVYGDKKKFLDYTHSYELHNQLIGVGSVIEQRNFLYSIAIFNKLRKIFPGLRFKIVGHIYYDRAMQFVRELDIADDVVFAGEQSHAVVLEEIQNSDIYMGIISGKYVGLGTATLEAMMMGIPVVSNVPGDLFGDAVLKDMEHYVYAEVNYEKQKLEYLQKNSDCIDDIVKKITRVLHQQGLRKFIGRGGRKFVLDNLAWESIAEKIEKVFM